MTARPPLSEPDPVGSRSVTAGPGLMQCVILAGGLGTRMQPVTTKYPKTLIEVCGRPFAHWQLDFLASQGITRVLYCLGHLGGQVRDYVEDGSRWGVEVDYVDEGDHLAGTAGALRRALDSGALETTFFVLYGDSYVQLPLRAVQDSFQHRSEPALMAVFRNEGLWDRSNVVYDGARVTLYDKHADPMPETMVYIDYGVSVLGAHLVEELVPGGLPFDLAPVYTSLSTSGRLAGFEATSRFYEIGSPGGLDELEAHLASSRRSPNRA